MTERRPRWVYGTGTEPDPRFTLANERTLLAWIRTSLAMSAAGLALLFTDQLLGDASQVLAAAAFALSLLVVVGAALRWARMERSLRLGMGLPPPWMAIGLVGAIALGAVIGAVAALWAGT